VTTVAFLGPAGTHTEEALLSLEMPDISPLSCASIEDVFTAVDRGKAALGIVPIENSIEGSVNATLDGLAFGGGIAIQQEVVRDIHHAIIVAPGVGRHDITSVAAHPQASGQCRKWLSTELSGKPVVAANSNAEAVQRAVAEPGVAAIGPRLAAELYGGVVLEDGIEDYGGNQTRFVVIGRGIQPKTGHDKTSLALFIHESRPGALLMILSEFAYGQINLTKIQSRPTKRQLGDYMFFVDLEGHVTDQHVSLALDCLRLKLREVRVLGSYAAAK
jgi:prephenate dehydratase